LFVAVEMPPAIKAVADGVAADWRRSAPPGVKWVPRENVHVTVKFLGWVEDERTESVAATVAGAVLGSVGFTVRLGGAGVFPSSRRARVLWLGLDDPSGGMAEVASLLDRAFESLGFKAEARAFVPHLTIGRLREPKAVSGLPSVPATEAFTVDRVTLFSSTLARPAPVYTPLVTFPFGR
jgi:2'-5' RNA ligase